MNRFEKQGATDAGETAKAPTQAESKDEERNTLVKKAFLSPLRKLLNKLYRAIKKDHKALEENQEALAGNQERLRISLKEMGDEAAKLFENAQQTQDRLQNTIEKASSRITQRHKDLCTGLKQQMAGLQERIEQIGRQQSHYLEKAKELQSLLNSRQEEIKGQLRDLHARLKEAKTAADADVIESIGAMVQDDDRLLRDIDEYVARCPENCFAHEFAEATIERLRGKRSERVALLQSHDVEVIDTAETFDPSVHQALGKVSRAGGETGQARVERIGFLRCSGEDRRVIQKALVSVFDDIEITFS